MIRSGAVCALVFFLLAGVAAQSGQAGAPGGAKQYDIRGIVRQAPDAEGKVVVEHEDVPGLMPSMTMPFRLADAAEGAGLKPGDGIAFVLTLGDGGSSIAQIKKIDPATITLPDAAPRPDGAETRVQRLKEGDSWPDFTLVDQNGQALNAADLAGHFTLLDFIFTRCAVPDYCPLMTRNFLEISSTLSGEIGAGRVRLLSISFDPHDTPDVLRQYAEAKEAAWTFATGTPVEIDRLTRAFSVRIEAEGGTYNHGLCTALVGPDGKILQLWRGNAWKPQEVIEAVQAALRAPQN